MVKIILVSNYFQTEPMNIYVTCENLPRRLHSCMVPYLPPNKFFLMCFMKKRGIIPSWLASWDHYSFDASTPSVNHQKLWRQEREPLPISWGKNQKVQDREERWGYLKFRVSVFEFNLLGEVSCIQCYLPFR